MFLRQRGKIMNLLITGAWQGYEECKEAIIKMGHQIHFLQWEKDDLPLDAAWVEGIIGNGIFLHHPIEKFVNLRYIQITSAGYDRVPMDYVKEHNITIHNARGVYSIPMAEFAMTGVLNLYKQTRFFQKNQENHLFEKNRILMELSGKNVCIAGCGSVGTECAKRFKAFGCQIMGLDLFPREDTWYDKMLGMEECDKVLPEADILILTMPLTKENHHFMNQERLSMMKKGAILVNIARGGIVDTAALITALENHLGGAVLDVFEEEPLTADSPLWDMEHVIVTPHNSFVGEGNRKRLNEVIVGNVLKA